MFIKGKSGNPAGRKKGAKTASTKLREQVEAVIPDIVAALINAAISGDTGAAKLLLDKCVPNIKPVSQLVEFNAPINDNLSATGQDIITAIARGNLAPDTGSQIINALTSLVKIIEVDELTKRVEVLENVANQK